MQPYPPASDHHPRDSRPSTRPLITADEALFHACLDNLSHQRCHIQCKPRLLDVLQHESLAGFLKICQRHIDFLIYRKGDWQPMVAIEFDDDTPAKSSRKERDRQLVTDVFLSLRVPLLRIHVREIDQIEALMHKLTTAWMQRLATLETMPQPVAEYPSRPLTEPLEIAAPIKRLIKSHSLLQFS
jgi:hypothetical protein